MKVINLDDINHGIRVAGLSLKLSKELNLSVYDTQIIYVSSLFHDIGKAYLNQDILNKPSRLTKEEKKHIEQHPFYGYREILQLGFSSEIALNILYHHENYDGTGYPIGLKGDNIPLGSRIIRICDIFDALVSNRPYRKSLSVEKAIEIIKSEKKNFCPFIFKSFIKMIDLKNNGENKNKIVKLDIILNKSYNEIPIEEMEETEELLNIIDNKKSR